MIFFTAQTHFVWRKKAEQRGFYDSGHMEVEIRRLWNEVVKPDDTVFMVGGIAFAYDAIDEILDQLNGEKIIVRGPYDLTRHYRKYKVVPPCYFTAIDGVGFLMNYYPLLDWSDPDKVVHVYGHVTEWDHPYPAVDVSMDTNKLTPVSLPEVLRRVTDAKIRLASDPDTGGVRVH